MTLQDNTIERLALAHGRLMIDSGYADGSIRVTAPSHAEWVVSESGTTTQQTTGNFTPESFAFAREEI